LDRRRFGGDPFAFREIIEARSASKKRRCDATTDRRLARQAETEMVSISFVDRPSRGRHELMQINYMSDILLKLDRSMGLYAVFVEQKYVSSIMFIDFKESSSK
jgi:hypothetical protein